jgi:hypothetical protein
MTVDPPNGETPNGETPGNRALDDGEPGRASVPNGETPGNRAQDDGEPGRGTEAETPFSGLRNPAAAIRGAAMGTLILEAIVLLLAIQPIRTVAPRTPGWGLLSVAVLALLCVLISSQVRNPWGWRLGLAIQVAVIGAGFLQYALFVLGAVFLAVWLYLLRVRSALAKPAEFDH